MQYSSNEKIGIMNKQLFNKKETIILLRNETDDVFSLKVAPNVLASMLANIESLGYQFTKEDILKMADMTENTLTEQVYVPLLEALKEAKGADVEHHILFPDFPHSVKALDIDTLSGFRFMSYFTTFYDEYLEQRNTFDNESLTSSLMKSMSELADNNADKQKADAPAHEEEYHGNGKDILNAIKQNSVKGENIDFVKKIARAKEQELITIHLGSVNDYYKMVNDMLSGKTSLSEYDKDIVRFALNNIAREKFMPDTIPFKETWALVAADDFTNKRYQALDIKSFKDFERLLAALTPNADISLAKKQRYRNFSNQERKGLYEVFKNALKNNYPIMCETAIPKYAKQFAVNVLNNRLHFDDMKDGHIFKDFIAHTNELRSKMSIYEEALGKKEYTKAAEVLASISPGVLLDHSKNLLAKTDKPDEILQIIGEKCKAAPMDKLLTLKKVVDSNISAEDEVVKFRFRRSKYVAVDPFINTSEKLSAETQEKFSNLLKDIIKAQLSEKEDIGKVYIDPALKKCPVPTVGRTDSGKNRTMATGTKVPYGGDKPILRAALYKKGPKDGFFDFSCAFLDENYSMVGQISWNNLKEGNFAYHSGDCADTRRGVTEIIDVNLDEINTRFPSAKYIVYEGVAWNSFTTVDELSECFLTLSNVDTVGEEIRGKGQNPLNPADVKFRVDLTGNSWANIPILYDIENREVSIMNMATYTNLNSFGEPDKIQRHFNLPSECVAIENYKGALAQTAYYINERLMEDKPSMYELAMLNVEARNGEVTEDRDEADTIFSIDREAVNENQKLVSIYDKDVINTEYMVPKAEEKEEIAKETVREQKEETIQQVVEIDPEIEIEFTIAPEVFPGMKKSEEAR